MSPLLADRDPGCVKTCELANFPHQLPMSDAEGAAWRQWARVIRTRRPDFITLGHASGRFEGAV
mgnify:CR=1 FL=1